MGGLDLCYGRWDTSQHVLIDEDHTAPDGPNGPVWRGKDYSNERVVEFGNLDKPFEDSIDRSKVPRMPWYVRPPWIDAVGCETDKQARCRYANRRSTR
jgi:phospholipase D1/2